VSRLKAPVMHRIYRILVGHPAVKLLFETRMYSWDYNVNVDLNEIHSNSGR
jgi:hypothetical protein